MLCSIECRLSARYQQPAQPKHRKPAAAGRGFRHAGIAVPAAVRYPNKARIRARAARDRLRY
jgi:hypothetical protein